MTRAAATAGGGDSAARTAVEQAFFRLDPGGRVTVPASSLTDPRAVTGWTQLLEGYLAGGPTAGAPGLTYVTLAGGQYAAVLRRPGGAPGGAGVHALLGLPTELTPDFALTSLGWSGWQDVPPVETALPRVDPRDVPVPDVGRALRAQALREAELLAAALAWLLQAPRAPIGFVGCPDGNRIPLLWALTQIARTQRASSIGDRSWTFSTRGDPAPGTPPADVTFLDATDDPQRQVGRIVVDLGGEQSASPQNVNKAFAMLYHFEFGVEPVEPAVSSAPSARTARTTPLDAPTAHAAPTSGSVAPSVPAPRRAELVADLVGARTGAQVRRALDRLDFAVSGVDHRDELRAELETAGWGFAVIERYVPPGVREREYDRLVRAAFGTGTPGHETAAARADARRLAVTAESDAFVRALARAAGDDLLDHALARRWVRQHPPTRPDPRAGSGPLGRFLRAHGRAVAPEHERRLLVAALCVALVVAFVAGLLIGIVVP